MVNLEGLLEELLERLLLLLKDMLIVVGRRESCNGKAVCFDGYRDVCAGLWVSAGVVARRVGNVDAVERMDDVRRCVQQSQLVYKMRASTAVALV